MKREAVSVIVERMNTIKRWMIYRRDYVILQRNKFLRSLMISTVTAIIVVALYRGMLMVFLGSE